MSFFLRNFAEKNIVMALKNKTDVFIFRVTSEEKIKLKQLLQKHKYHSVSHFFRCQMELLWKKPIPVKVITREEKMEDIALLLKSEIGKIGVNINQIARRVNITCGTAKMSHHVEKTLGYQENIVKLLEVVIRSFEKYVGVSKN